MLVYIDSEIEKFMDKYFKGSAKAIEIQNYFQYVLDCHNRLTYAANKTLERFKADRV